MAEARLSRNFCTVHDPTEPSLKGQRDAETAMRRRQKGIRVARMRTWRCLRQRLEDNIKKKEKSERRGRTVARGKAMKRGGFAQSMVEIESNEDESTGQGRICAQLEPLEGRAILIEQCIRVRLSWLKAQCGGRDYGALSDLCVTLEGGDDVTLVPPMLTIAPNSSESCRGEVCIYMTSTHRYFRINNFVFECFISMTCERMHTQMQSTWSDEHVSL